MATTKKDALGLALLKALGLEDDRVRKLTLTCEVDEVDVVQVEYLVADAETADLVTEARRYVLTDVT